MTISATGQVDANAINTEINNASTTGAGLNVNANNVRMLAGQSNGASGQINYSSFLGKTYMDGSTSARAAPNALYIKQLTGTTTNGVYWINPGSAVGATQVYCDMNINGGGYMLVARSYPTAAPASGTWGWRGTAQGAPTTYTAAYQLPIYTWYQAGFTFSNYLFGNQYSNNSNTWGPFVYQVGISNLSTFLTSDTQQSGSSYTTVQSNTNVYGSTGFPGMQGAIGYPISGTSSNFYYMRDCCGFAGYGATPTGMVTTYCSSTSVQFYCGPWCNGSTTSGSVYVQGGSSSAGNTGGTNQYMIMVQ